MLFYSSANQCAACHHQAQHKDNDNAHHRNNYIHDCRNIVCANHGFRNPLLILQDFLIADTTSANQKDNSYERTIP
jgi:hypothetical protein